MTQTLQGPETIVDDELVDAIKRWQQTVTVTEHAQQAYDVARAAYDAAKAVSSAPGASHDATYPAERKAQLAFNRAQCDLEEAGESQADASIAWNRQVDEKYDGAAVIMAGTLYTPHSSEGDTLDFKYLRSSGSPADTGAVAQNGHMNMQGQGLETIVDGELVDVIRKWHQAKSKCAITDERFRVARETHEAATTASELPGGRGAQCPVRYRAELAEDRAACDSADAGADQSEAWEEWQGILKDRYEGAIAILDGTAYAPQDNEEDTCEAKVLRLSGAPRANGHADGTAPKSQCQCAADVPPADLIPSEVTGRNLWMMVIRRAIAARLEAQAWRDKIESIEKASRRDQDRKLESASWAAHIEQFEAQQYLVGCLLAYHGVIEGPDDIGTLPDDWQAVGLEVDGLVYLVRSDSDPTTHRETGVPTLDITTPASIERLSA